jgi:hypothetical protein
MFLDLRVYRHTRRSMGSRQRPFQGYPRNIPSIPFYFNSCLKTTRMYPPVSYRRHLLRNSGAPWFMFYAYGFDLSDRIWFVSLVMTLIVTCVFTTILVVTPLRIRFVRQNLVCVPSDDFDSCLCFYNDSRCDTLHAFLCVSFAWAAHDVRSFWKLYRLTAHHSSSVTFVPWLSPFFIRL